jgi:hypothetical protein
MRLQQRFKYKVFKGFIYGTGSNGVTCVFLNITMRRSVSVSRLCYLYNTCLHLYYIVLRKKSLSRPYFIGVYKNALRHLPYNVTPFTLQRYAIYPTKMVLYTPFTLRIFKSKIPPLGYPLRLSFLRSL